MKYKSQRLSYRPSAWIKWVGGGRWLVKAGQSGAATWTRGRDRGRDFVVAFASSLFKGWSFVGFWFVFLFVFLSGGTAYVVKGRNTCISKIYKGVRINIFLRCDKCMRLFDDYKAGTIIVLRTIGSMEIGLDIITMPYMKSSIHHGFILMLSSLWMT